MSTLTAGHRRSRRRGPTTPGGPGAHHASVTHLDGRRSYDAPVVPAPPVPDTRETGVLTLSPTGRRGRLAPPARGLALLPAGPRRGHHFRVPLRPLPLYSAPPRPHPPVASPTPARGTAPG